MPNLDFGFGHDIGEEEYRILFEIEQEENLQWCRERYFIEDEDYN